MSSQDRPPLELTASEWLRQNAPDALTRADELDVHLSEAVPAMEIAQDIGLWNPRPYPTRYLQTGMPFDDWPEQQLRSSGLLGTGITRLPESGNFVPVVFVRLGRPLLRVSVEPNDAPDLARFWELLQRRDVEPGDAVVIGIPEPTAQVAPADAAHCNGPPGTFGARVTTRAGKRGLLTAGHVAPRMPASAYTDQAVYVGQVVETFDIAAAPPRTPGIDVAVIELAATALDTGVSPVALPNPAPGQIWDAVTGWGAVTPKAPAKLLTVGRPFAGPSAAHGYWDDAAMTDVPISTGGDSGGAVVNAQTGALLGHIVGGYPGVYSIVQDATAQLRAVGASLR